MPKNQPGDCLVEGLVGTPSNKRLDADVVAEFRAQRERISVLREDLQKIRQEKEELRAELNEALEIEDQLRNRLDSVRRTVELVRQVVDDDPVVLSLLRNLTSFTNNIAAPIQIGMVGLTD